MVRQVGFLVCNVPPETLNWVAEHAPELHLLGAAHLCERDAWVRAWAAKRSVKSAVVVPCGDPCWQRLSAALAALGPFSVHRVEPPGGDLRRFEALARGKIRRAQAESALPPEGVKYRLPFHGGPVSRRDLLKLPVHRTAVPLPLLDGSACRSRWRCQRCVEVCPTRALSLDRGVLAVDRGRCEGCGYCVTVCPTGALRLPGVSFAEVLSEVRGALSVRGGPRVVLFHCRTRASPLFPVEVLCLPLPCVGMLSLRWILAPLVEGAGGVLVLEPSERCHPWHDGARARLAISVGQLVLSGLGVERERVAVVGSPAEVKGEVRRLHVLPSLGELGARSLENSSPELSEILQKLADRGDGNRPSVSGETLPFGTALVDRARCSLCGVCAAACPVGALSFSEDASEATLAFNACRCDGCRACEAYCPERAITIKRELRVETFGELRPLHRGKVVRCQRCGAQVASANLIRALRAKLGGNAETAWLLQHCPSCRMVAGLQVQGRDRHG